MRPFRMITLLSLLTALLLPGLSFAQSAVTVNPIKLVNIPQHLVGNYLTVYYGIGNRAAIATNSNQVTLKKIRKKVDNIPLSSTMAAVPAVDIPRLGFYQPYNIIVFVIHSKPNFNWVNLETDSEGNLIRTIPDGEPTGSNIMAQASLSFTKTELEDLSMAQGVPNVIEVDLQNRIQMFQELE